MRGDDQHVYVLLPPRSSYELTITDVDECELNSTCTSSNAVCVNTDGSFLCRCNEGFEWNGFTCMGTFTRICTIDSYVNVFDSHLS